MESEPETLPDGCGARVSRFLEVDDPRDERLRTAAPISASRPGPPDHVRYCQQGFLSSTLMLVAQRARASEGACEACEIPAVTGVEGLV